MIQPDYIERYRLLCATAPDSDERAALSNCWCLAYSGGPIPDTLCAHHLEVKGLLLERRANGDAFAGEKPMRVWAASAHFFGRVRLTTPL